MKNFAERGTFLLFGAIFFNWDSLHARLKTATTRHGVTANRSTKRSKHTENLFKNNLQLKGFC